MKWTAAFNIAILTCTTGVAAADDAKSRQERAGNCEQTKAQRDFFCDPNSTELMSQFGACDNAKKNVKLACEGIDEGDRPYKFDK